jgi:Ni/Co efflux regulator RcnB
LSFSLLCAIAMAFSVTTQAQYSPQYPQNDRYRNRDRNRDRDRDRDWNRDRDRDRDWNRDRDYRNGRGGYGNSSRFAFEQGYRDGLYTGENDARRGQSYNPQRSHFYRNQAHNQGYREGFVRGYNEGFRRYRGYNRGNNTDPFWRR